MKNDKKMYVVMEHGGQYEDVWSTVVCVSDDREKAIAYADKMNQIYASMSGKKEEFYKTILPDWEKIHEVKNTPPKGLLVVPKWPSGSIVTDAMREERVKIQEHNRQILVKHDEPFMAYCEAKDLFIKDWMLSHLTEDEYVLAECNDHNYWSVSEDIPML